MTSPASEVAAAGQALAAAGLEDMVWGHVARRDPEGRGAWIKSSGWSFDEVTVERVLLVGWNGEVLAGRGSRHAETPLHLQVLLGRGDVDWVVHTHSPAVNVFTSLDIPMRAVSHDGVLFADHRLPRFPDGDLITTAERGDLLAATLGDDIACLLPAHGVVCVGPSAAAAVMHNVLLDRACAAMVAAHAGGGPVRWSDDEELRRKAATTWPASQMQAGFDFLLRRAQRAGCSR